MSSRSIALCKSETMSVRYKIEHLTTYEYPSPVLESFGHMRVLPRDLPGQKLLSHKVYCEPAASLSAFSDYFGNTVHAFSVPQKHEHLKLLSKCEVEVSTPVVPAVVKEVTVAEARQILHSRHLEHYDFFQSTQLVPVEMAFLPYVKRFFKPATEIFDAILQLNEYIHTRFQYRMGKTGVETTATEVARTKRGVCQDFAHFMLGVLRMAAIPARYVSGYIETNQARSAVAEGHPNLVGAAATHAWVEALLPGDYWVGLDPTNNILAGDRHIIIARGRDYSDVAPARGIYRGSRATKLDVSVRVCRVADVSANKKGKQP